MIESKPKKGATVVAKSLPDALVWYRKAAEQGHAISQNDLGSMYQFGVGIGAPHGGFGADEHYVFCDEKMSI